AAASASASANAMASASFMETALAEKTRKGERRPALPQSGWSPSTDAEPRLEPDPRPVRRAAPRADKADAAAPAEGERIAKVIARAGLCSRRDAEKMVLEGRVTVDGAVIASPALNVSANSLVAVDGKPLAAPEAARMWRYHKPPGLV